MKSLDWLDQAKWAASGGNAQPWTAAYEETENSVAIELSIDAAYRAHPSAMDLSGTASTLALGCLATNLHMIAAGNGFVLTDLRVSERDSLWTSSVRLLFGRGKATGRVYGPDDIRVRHTNRYPFRTTPIDAAVRSNLEAIARSYARVRVAEFAEAKMALVPGLFALERIRWQDKRLLQSLFEELHFRHDATEASGLIEADQLGISPVEQWFLRLLRDVRPLRLLFRCGLDRIIARQSLTQGIRNCDRVYFLEAADASFRSCFELGRCFQEQWLEVNKAALAFQPIGLPLIAFEHWRDEGGSRLRPEQRRAIESVTRDFGTKFRLDFKKPMIGFRVGVPTRAPKRSSRKPVAAQIKPGLSAD